VPRSSRRVSKRRKPLSRRQVQLPRLQRKQQRRRARQPPRPLSPLPRRQQRRPRRCRQHPRLSESFIYRVFPRMSFGGRLSLYEARAPALARVIGWTDDRYVKSGFALFSKSAAINMQRGIQSCETRWPRGAGKAHTARRSRSAKFRLVSHGLYNKPASWQRSCSQPCSTPAAGNRAQRSA
jgi:hypothetical protein